jgi:hypothetical protein
VRRGRGEEDCRARGAVSRRTAARSTRTLGVIVYYRSVTAVLVLMALAASAETPSPVPFQVDRSRWEAADPPHYEYSIIHYGGPYRPMAMRIIVNAGQVTSATLLCISPLSEEDCQAWSEDISQRPKSAKFLYPASTIPQLFDYIDHIGNTRGGYVEIELDATYGYPRHCRLDNTMAFDAEHVYDVIEFTVLR